MPEKIGSKRLSDYSKVKNTVLEKVTSTLKRGIDRKIALKKGEKTLAEIPLTVGLGSATAAIIISSTFTAVAALVALSNDIRIDISKNLDDTSTNRKS